MSKPIFITKGRGATTALEGRFETRIVDSFDDGWARDGDDGSRATKTHVTEEQARSILSTNDSPDIPFERSLNPYRGCEHGCSYCYARPSHAYLNLSPGIDFETKLFAKMNAAQLLRTEIAKKNYTPSPINFGANTDPYQPIERKYALTRACLAVLNETQHPCTIVTKNALVTRDIDILTQMAQKKLVHVFLSITSLDNELSRVLEPRASAPANRIAAIKQLSDAGIPTSVLVAPIIPFITDEWIERVAEAAKAAGAITLGYTVIRLPWEVNPVFQDWLRTHFPDRAQRVMERIRDLRDGHDNSTVYGERMKGTGIYAELIKKRVEVARTRFLYLRRNQIELETAHFRPPGLENAPKQASLFD